MIADIQDAGKTPDDKHKVTMRNIRYRRYVRHQQFIQALLYPYQLINTLINTLPEEVIPFL